MSLHWKKNITELMEKSKAMAPMTKEEWEKRQSVVRRVLDEESGRYRLSYYSNSQIQFILFIHSVHQIIIALYACWLYLLVLLIVLFHLCLSVVSCFQVNKRWWGGVRRDSVPRSPQADKQTGNTSWWSLLPISDCGKETFIRWVDLTIFIWDLK